jgi:integrase
MMAQITDNDDKYSQKIRGIRAVPEPSREILQPRQLEDYYDYRKELINWSLNLGKSPGKAIGYAPDTADGYLSRLDIFYREVWKMEDGYTTNVTHNHADSYAMEFLAPKDCSTENKSTHQKAIKMLFRWRSQKFGDEEWDNDISFTTNTNNTNPPQWFTKEERSKLRDAALDHGSVPAYNGLSPVERREWKAYLAQRFRKDKEDVTKKDFQKANSWKIPSLVGVSLDAGLRPIEVERSRIQWVNTDSGMLEIPADESSKNRDNWHTPLTEKTTNILKKWIDEREQYDKYDDCDDIWLTREQTPYQSGSLKRIVRKLCDHAGFDHRGRTWYAIRHSVGTNMTEERGLKATQSQLRHQDHKTTMRYDGAPVDQRRDALDRMG